MFFIVFSYGLDYHVKNVKILWVHIISKVIPPIYKMSSEVILLNIKETLVLNIYIYI